MDESDEVVFLTLPDPRVESMRRRLRLGRLSNSGHGHLCDLLAAVARSLVRGEEVRAELREVVNDLFLLMLGGPDAGDDGGLLDDYLDDDGAAAAQSFAEVCRRALVARYRREADAERRRARILRRSVVPAESLDPDDEAALRERLDRLRADPRLEARDAPVLALKHRGDAQTEIAEALGLSDVQVCRAWKRICRLLDAE